MKKNGFRGIGMMLITVLLAGGILVLAEGLLRPIINGAGASEDQAVLEKLFAGVTEFTPVEFTDESGIIQKVYEAKDAGYAYILENQGYAAPIGFAVALDNEGKITGYEVTSFNDTPNIGSKVMEEPFISSIVGKTSTDSFAVISGATFSSSAVVKGLDAVKLHFNTMKNITDDGPKEPSTPVEPPLNFGDSIKVFREVSPSKVATITGKEENGDVITYTITVPGYAVLEGGYDGAKPNVLVVTVDKAAQTIVSVEVTEANDTLNLGTKISHEDFLAQFKDLSYADESVSVDVISSATVSSTSVVNAVLAAIQASK